LIWSPEKYFARNTDHKAPHYVVFIIPCHLVSLDTNSSSAPYCRTPRLTFLPQCETPSFTATKTTTTIGVLYILMLISFDSKLEGKIFCIKWQQAFSEFNLLLIHQECIFYLLGLFPNIWTVLHRQGFITYLYVVILSCILFTWHER
jgi:hypothetical protein